ncbi:MAG: hypothetical protein JRJ86_23880 [Deltaproteobacteria bacterium]|nr:hypothetical protein [Deltaproteobacteria bacterium]
MTPYKGIIRINCQAKTCPEKIIKNVRPACLTCPQALAEILGLDGETIFAGNPSPEGPTIKNKIRKT